LTGTGPNGRVIAADVSDWLASASARAAAAPAPAAAAAAPAAADARAGFSDVAASGVRRVIAARLTASKQAVPHYYLTSEIALDALLAMRATLNADLPAEGKLSVNDFIIRAAALACKRVPEVNSSWLDSVIRTYDYVDISVAVAVPDGLITPIVRDAHVKGLSAINRRVRARARARRARYLRGARALTPTPPPPLLSRAARSSRSSPRRAQRSCSPTSTRAARSRSRTSAPSACDSLRPSSTRRRRASSPSAQPSAASCLTRPRAPTASSRPS